MDIHWKKLFCFLVAFSITFLSCKQVLKFNLNTIRFFQEIYTFHVKLACLYPIPFMIGKFINVVIFLLLKKDYNLHSCYSCFLV